VVSRSAASGAVNGLGASADSGSSIVRALLGHRLVCVKRSFPKLARVMTSGMSRTTCRPNRCNTANALYGNAGNNLLNGASDADRMLGGAGNDTNFVDNAGDLMFENANEGTNAVFASVNHGLTANMEAMGCIAFRRLRSGATFRTTPRTGR
jgi:hypothetical protein